MHCVYTFGGRVLAWALGNLKWSQLKHAVSVEGLQASRKALRDFRFLTGNIMLNKGGLATTYVNESNTWGLRRQNSGYVYNL